MVGRTELMIVSLIAVMICCSISVFAYILNGGRNKPSNTTGPGPSPGPAPSFTESCKDLGGTYGDNDTVTTLDGCKASCSGNTHDHNFTCKGIIYQQISDNNEGKPLCRLYDNKDLDSSVDICPSGLKSYTLN